MQQQFIIECAACGGALLAGPSEDADELAQQATAFIASHRCPATPDPARQVEREVDEAPSGGPSLRAMGWTQ